MVASYYSESSSPNLMDYGSQLVNEINKKFVDIYTKNSEGEIYKLGDATYEVKGWNEDKTEFIVSEYPFYRRGGNHSDGISAGIFHCSRIPGWGTDSFRLCLII